MRRQQPGDPRRTLEVFYVDAYEYPPQFLVLPQAFVALTQDFLRARALWFLFQTLVFAGALMALAWHFEGPTRRRFVWIAPLLYLCLPVQISLQLGNFQVLAFALAMTAMVAFARGREVVGAGLLSFAMAAKLFPAVLLVLLVGQRAWRALLWTFVWSGVWIGLSLLLFGAAPFDSFFRYHLPRVASGEAFPQLQVPFAIGINHAIQSIPAKLALFGIGTGSLELGATLAWIYTLVPCAVALFVMRAANTPLSWALVLGLASYRSPFLPQEYASMGPVLVLCLLAVDVSPSRARWWLGFAVTFAMLQLQVPWGISRDPMLGALVNGISQVTAVAVFGAAIRYLRRRASRNLAAESPRPASLPFGAISPRSPRESGT